MSGAAVSAEPAVDAQAAAGGLVMMCDVDLALPDATRTHTLEVARGFARLGLDVDLIARGPDPRLPGVRYAAAGGTEAQRLTRAMTLNARAISLLWRRRASARRLYVRDKWTCFPAVLAGRLLGYHVVLQVDGIPYGRGADEGSPPARFLKLVLAIAMGRLVNGVLAVTPKIRALLIEEARVPGERISVIPNGVDLDLFQPLPRVEAIDRLGLDPRCRYIVFLGGFYEWADFDTMLAGFAAVVDERPDARLVLIGDGPERALIERRAGELGLKDRLIITGLLHDRSRVRDYLGAATIALLVHRRDKVSRTGASPIKLMEYLAAGRAVVTVDFAGGSEMVREAGAGVLVPAGAQPLAEAILDLVVNLDRADQLGECGRRYAEQHLSWTSVVSRTLPLFELSRSEP